MLDEILGGADAPLAPAPAPPTAAVSAPQAAGGSDSSPRFTVSLPLSILERARTAVYFSPGLTLAGLTAEALSRELARLEAERGEPFPIVRGPLRSGRPIR